MLRAHFESKSALDPFEYWRDVETNPPQIDDDYQQFLRQQGCKPFVVASLTDLLYNITNKVTHWKAYDERTRESILMEGPRGWQQRCAAIIDSRQEHGPEEARAAMMECDEMLAMPEDLINIILTLDTTSEALLKIQRDAGCLNKVELADNHDKQCCQRDASQYEKAYAEHIYNKNGLVWTWRDDFVFSKLDFLKDFVTGNGLSRRFTRYECARWVVRAQRNRGRHLALARPGWALWFYVKPDGTLTNAIDFHQIPPALWLDLATKAFTTPRAKKTLRVGTNFSDMIQELYMSRL